MKITDHDILIELKTMAKETSKDIKNVMRTLHGNGRDGIISVIDKHDVQISTLFHQHKEDLEEFKDQKKRDLTLLSLFVAMGILIIAVITVFLP